MTKKENSKKTSGFKNDIFIKKKSDEAVFLLEKHGIPATPANYHVWFTYTADYDQSLKKTIDHFLLNDKKFTYYICNKIYQKFISNDKENRKISDTGDTLQNELSKIANHLKTSIKGTSTFSESLKKQVKSLNNETSAENLTNTIKNIINDANNIKNQAKKTQTDLEKSSLKIQKLQIDLESARFESRTDMLTNIGNRKSFDEVLSSAIKNFKTTDTPFSIIICDIDFFKKFNDKWGHVTGDQVLKAVAQVIKTTIGDKGTPTRYGGEEFAIILPNITLAESILLAEKTREYISSHSIKKIKTGEYVSKITMSFGVAEYHAGETAVETVIKADTALYNAKDSGRNNVKAYELT